MSENYEAEILASGATLHDLQNIGAGYGAAVVRLVDQGRLRLAGRTADELGYSVWHYTPTSDTLPSPQHP